MGIAWRLRFSHVFVPDSGSEYVSFTRQIYPVQTLRYELDNGWGAILTILRTGPHSASSKMLNRQNGVWRIVSVEIRPSDED